MISPAGLPVRTSVRVASRRSLSHERMSRPVAGLPLPTQAPFHLEATVRVLQRRPSSLIDVWENNRYLRMFAIADRVALVAVENRGAIDAPDVSYSILSGDRSAATVRALGPMVRRILGLDADPALLQYLARTDRTLRSTVLALRGLRPPRFATLFEAFARVIPFQQLSLDAGVAIVGRLVERFGQQLEHGGRRYHAFPTVQTIAHARLDRLRACGLSSRKAQTLRDVARAIDSGNLNEEEISGMSTSAALRTLIGVPGIGPWSAGLILLRGLGRIDVFPPGDVGAARGVGAILRLEPKTPIDDVVERFGDHRGYLYFCGLGASLMAKGLVHAAPRRRSS